MSGSGEKNPGDRSLLSRRNFLTLGGAGIAAGLGFGGYAAYRELRSGRGQGPPVSLARQVGRGIGVSGATGINIILVIIDSLRLDAIHATGGGFARDFGRDITPNIDKFFGESLSFPRMVPEAMPTIPARRTLHTGMRTFPFRGWNPPEGENVLLRGWQPVPDGQWTVAEILASAGYRTMMVTDNCHEAKPGYNFQRGFAAFDLIRGQEKDLYRPIWLCPEEKIENTLMSGNRAGVEGKMRQYFANTSRRTGEEDYFAPQVFARAAEWTEGAREEESPFFLVVDSFDPHEPWDPPDEFVKLFGEGYDEYPGKEPYVPVYGGMEYLEEAELGRMKVLYAAELAMVDRWFGRFMDGLDSAGILDDTAVLLTSDHGIAFGEHGTVGKPHYALWPEVTDVPLAIRHPEGKLAGKTSNYRASTHDVVPTMLSLAGVSPPYDLDGEDLTPLFDGQEPGERGHLSGGLHDYIFARDDDYAFIAGSTGRDAKLYDLRNDPDQENDISGENREVTRRMFEEYVLEDAGGEIPSY